MKNIGWTNETVISCEGHEKENTKHPKVWLNMSKSNSIICPYCGHEYRLKVSEDKVK